VVGLSWAVALAVWPLTWWVLSAAQGVGVILLGGQWIGLSAPLGAAPWALVNEPGIAFAVSRGALYGYWLAPFLLAAVIALLVPVLLPGGSGWLGELFAFHLANACAVLGLGWSPALGSADGALAGLRRFWEIDPGLAATGAAAAGVVAVQAQAARLVAPLWDGPGGPLRRRRVGAALAHGLVPAVVWWGATVALGWSPPTGAVAGAAVVVAALIAAAWIWVPRHPRLRRPAPGPTRVLAASGLGVCVAAVALWFGAPRGGSAQAVLWAAEGTTSNVRADRVRVRLRPLPDPRERPGPSGRGS